MRELKFRGKEINTDKESVEKKMSEEQDDFEYRNTHPHREAEIARLLYAVQYENQDGGVMDFWDSLSSKRKEYCVCLVDELESPPRCKEHEEGKEEKG